MQGNYLHTAQDDLDEQAPLLSLDIPDNRLLRMARQSLEESITHWNTWPYNLEQADRSNLRYWLGEQMGDAYAYDGKKTLSNMGNRLLTSSRAVIAYVNSRVAKPETTPSTSNPSAQQFASDAAAFMYQHGVDHDLDTKAKKCTASLVIRKRAYLKAFFDPNCGPYGDIEVLHIDPSDIVVDKNATFDSEPARIFHRQWCTVEELIIRFPGKAEEIKKNYGINRGVYTQMSERVGYWELWFTTYDKGKRVDGLMWFLDQGQLVLNKVKNPNWIYTGDEQEEREINFLPYPPKPFIVFNYLNTGKGYIDETSLFEQAKVMQDLYNKRAKQRMLNNDRMDGRSVADANAFNEQKLAEFVNSKQKNPVMLVKPSEGQTLRDSFINIQHNPLPRETAEEMYDAREQIDEIMGSSAIMRGQSDAKAETLGENQLLLQRADALQDDLATAVDSAMKHYYRLLFHLMKVYYTEEHWMQVRGDDGKFDFVVMHGEAMDTNIKISIEAGSTLPTNKQEIRSLAIQAANAKKIDDLTFWEAMVRGVLPSPENIVTRLNKQLTDPAAFVADVDKQLYNREADSDITVILSGRMPSPREEYNQGYIEHINNYIMSPKFLDLEPKQQEGIKTYLALIGSFAARSVNLGETQQDDAAMTGLPEQQLGEQVPTGLTGAVQQAATPQQPTLPPQAPAPLSQPQPVL